MAGTSRNPGAEILDPRERDVIVVGGGHNGLVSACYLARAGLDVLVLEKSDRLGGMTLSAPLADDAPDHLLSPCAYENAYLRAAGVAEELELASFGYREVDSAGWAWLGEGGESLCFVREIEATVAEISRFSRADAAAYREFVEVALRILALQDAYGRRQPSRPGARLALRALRSLATDRKLRRTIAAAMTGTAADLIVSTFESPEVRGAFASIGSILSPLTLDGSGIAALATPLLHHMGTARPIGGMGGLISALQRCLSAHGGDSATGTEAVGLGVAGGRVRSVELGDSSAIGARRAVLFAIPPQRIPAIAAACLEDELAQRLGAAPANAHGVGTLTVNLALGARLELPRHERPEIDLRRPTLFTGSIETVIAATERAAQGLLPERYPWTAAILSAVDPSQAPEGEDVVQLYGPAPTQPADGWGAAREPAAEALIAQAEATIDGLRDLEVGRYVETPADLGARTGAENGCIYHVDITPTRLGPLRPARGAGAYRAGAPGLYVTGAGAHPGGGVSGLPGKLASQALLADLGSATG